MAESGRESGIKKWYPVTPVGKFLIRGDCCFVVVIRSAFNNDHPAKTTQINIDTAYGLATGNFQLSPQMSLYLSYITPVASHTFKLINLLTFLQ